MITGPRDTLKRARKLRSEMSLPEVKLWQELRKRPGGFKFRRQHAAGKYIIDFFCAAAKLAIEIDGWSHNSPVTRKRDAAKSHFLRSQGVATVRVPAQAVLDDPAVAAQRLAEICLERMEAMSRADRVPLHHPADGPPPHAGED